MYVCRQQVVSRTHANIHDENVTSPLEGKLGNGAAAVDEDDLAGHVRRRRHAEEGHHGRHLLRLADPPHGQPLQLLLHQLRVYRLLLDQSISNIKPIVTHENEVIYYIYNHKNY